MAIFACAALALEPPALPANCPPISPLPDAQDLLQLARYAHCHQPRWLKAHAETQMRAAEWGQRQAAWWPTAQLSISGQRTTPAESIFSEPRQDLDHTRNQTLSFNWRLLDAGQRKHEQDAAQFNLEGSLWQAQAGYQTLLLGVAMRHTEVQAAAWGVQTERGAAQVAADTAATVQARLSRGISSSADWARAKAASQEAHLAWQSAVGQYQLTLTQLALEIGASSGWPLPQPDDDAGMPPQRAVVPEPGSSPTALPPAAFGTIDLDVDVDGLPSVKAARSAWEAARARVSAATSALGPALDLSVQRSLSKASVGSTNPDRPRDTRLSLTLQIPLFDGGTAHHLAKAALAEVHSRALDLQEARLQAQAELSLVAAQRLQSQRARALASALLAERQTVLASTHQRLRLGAAELQEVLQAQVDVAQAQRAWVRAQSERAQSHWRGLAASQQLSMGALVAGVPP